MSLTIAGSIRLVELYPAEGELWDDIHCRITHERLSNRPEYEALSYTWRNHEDTHEIWCSGRHLSITKNLRAALHHLRYAAKPRKLWIDAICIYSYRTATKCCRNLRFRPQFCEGFDSNPQKPVRALGAPLGLGCSCQLYPHVSAEPAAWIL
jgi:hypothetical protein